VRSVELIDGCHYRRSKIRKKLISELAFVESESHHCFDPEIGILPYASQPSKNIPFRIPENLKSTTITATMVLL
jgi:hypothetical protein